MNKSNIVFLYLLFCVFLSNFVFAQTPTSKTKTRYEVGLTVGTPARIQPSLGVNLTKKFGLRVSGMAIPSANGIQFNVFYHLKDNWSIGSAFGYSSIDDSSPNQKWTYAGLFSSLNLHGFYVESGLSWGKGDYTSPQMLIQVGYVYRFWK